MILIDHIGHMISDTCLDELHAFAESIGLKRVWFQGDGRRPHYDLTTPAMKMKAIKAGAKPVRSEDIVKALWRLRNGTNGMD